MQTAVMAQDVAPAEPTAMALFIQKWLGGATVGLGAPIEQVSDPAIGWPSEDTTRQVTT